MFSILLIGWVVGVACGSAVAWRAGYKRGRFDVQYELRSATKGER